MNGKVSLNEVLVKTSYLTQISNSDIQNPIAFGSGFIINYKKERFFVTADHTLHLDDYKNGLEERTWNDYTISIFNNYQDPENALSTIITPLGGFHYMEKYNLEKLKEKPELVDITACKMKDLNFKYPFLTDKVEFCNREIINSGQQKFELNEICLLEEIDENLNYFIFGKVKTKIIDNIRLHWENTLKESLKYVTTSGDFYIFNTEHLITDKKDWEGLSGSPVLNEKGECIGVLCDVLENSKSLWIMPISKVKLLLDVIIQQEKI